MYILVSQVLELLVLLSNPYSLCIILLFLYYHLLLKLSLLLFLLHKMIQLVLVQLFHRYLWLLLSVRRDTHMCASTLGLALELIVHRFAVIVERCWWLSVRNVVIEDWMHLRVVLWIEISFCVWINTIVIRFFIINRKSVLEIYFISFIYTKFIKLAHF